MANRNWIERASYVVVIRNPGRELEITLYVEEVQG